MTSDTPGYNLAHPLYLDVPMIMSFLAHLEGGVAIGGSETTIVSGSRERLLKGRGGFRAKLWTIAEADIGAEGSTQNRDETSSESQTERHHTAASLFNVLYGYLVEDGQIMELESPDSLAELRPGELIELAGEYLGNPIEDILAFFKSFLPYMIDHRESEQPAPIEPVPPTKRSGNPAKRAEAERRAVQAAAVTLVSADGDAESDDESAAGIKLLLRMADDISVAPVHDLLFHTDAGLKAVVTVGSEFYSATTNEHLRAGQFRVVGKVTKVIRGGQTINLTRRTVLGAAGPGMAQEIIGGFTAIEELAIDVAEPIVAAPAVQILPMAIFI